MTNVYHKSPEIIVKALEKRVDELPQTTDDLAEIKGIGSGTVEKLNARRIYTYRQLAELSPEELSETPGIGIATARKFIEEAKNLLGEFQEQNCELNETIQQRKVTPYEQLLSRSDDKSENVILEPKEIETIETKTETEFDNIESYEVAKVIVEEELPQEKSYREEKPVETIQKQWFSDKFNYSRLTASHPAALERRSKRSKMETKVEERREEEIEQYQQAIFEIPEIPEQLENNADVEPFEGEMPFPEEAIPREDNVVIPISTELSEVTKISEVEVPKIAEVQKVSEVPVILEIPEIPEILEPQTRARTPNRHEELIKEAAESLKDLGYYSIPKSIEGLTPFFQNIDYIGLKLVPVNDYSKLIVLVPIKICDLEGTLLIHEDKIDYKAYSKARESNLTPTARQYVDALLNAKEIVFEDVVNGEKFLEFFEKYLQVRFKAEKGAKNKKLYFISRQEQTQYKVLIEPILLTKIPAKCMEKSILFPYQRKTNLHIIDIFNIGHLLRFLERKYKLIESRAKKSNSIEIYQTADAKFRSSLKMASLPFLGYSVVLLVIYFSQLYFLLRLFNSIGFAAIGIYSLAIGYFYFKFYNTKKELTTEFETPYYLQKVHFSDTDLLIVGEEFTSEQMIQFGYECFGKDNDFKVLEQIEKNNIEESVVAKQHEQVAPDLFELDSDQENSSTREELKNEVKYGSFFED